jgi:hypothetical protein
MCKVFRRALLIIVKQKGIFISKYAFFAMFLVPSGNVIKLTNFNPSGVKAL